MDDYIEKKENVESRLAEVVSFVRTNETEPWIIDSKELYKYDDSGKLAERRAYSVDGNTIGKETYVYDSKGKIKQWEMSEYYMMEDMVSPRILVYYTDKDGKLTLSQSIQEALWGRAGAALLLVGALAPRDGPSLPDITAWHGASSQNDDSDPPSCSLPGLGF